MRRHLVSLACLVCLSALVVGAVAGCSGSANTGTTSGGSSNTGGGMMGSGSSSGTGGMMGGSGSTAGSYSSVGQRIWLTGVGSNGQDIQRTAPRVSQGALMMGGGGCASCHGTDGKGGTVQMMTGPAIQAPDVTYSALIKAGFTDATIRRAITDGLDESGKPLKDAMPRWQMGTTDLDATIAYLKILGS